MGSIRKVARKKPWLARFNAGDRTISKAFERKADAERWLRAEESKYDRGEWVDPRAGEIPFEEWAEEWLRSLVLKPSTRANYESNLRYRILPTFGGVELRKIRPTHVRRWQNKLRDEGLSENSIRQARQVLSAILNQAARENLITRNPTDGVGTPKARPRRQRYLNADEVEALAQAAEKRREGAGAFIRFLAWSGLRWGEAIALKWGRVDTKTGRVEVQEAITEVGGKIIWGSPKTHEIRTVYVPMRVIRELGEPKKKDDLVFTAPRGGVLRNSNFKRSVWVPAVADAGLGDLTPHDLRDTAASLMISAGATIKAVQRALGHASAAMTLDVYGGLFEEDLAALQARVEERYFADEAEEEVS